MAELRAFVSVGGTANERQENFVRAIEDRLRSEGIAPHTVGRNTFSVDTPLKQAMELMASCSGCVVIALERTYFPTGFDKRGGTKQTELKDVMLPTPWNHIEAALAYARDLPLLVMVETGLKSEGLLERGNDWYVQYVDTDVSALNTNEFNGVLASWKEKMLRQPAPAASTPTKAVTDLTVAELVGGLKPAQLYSVLGALVAALAAAFAAGAKLIG